MPRKSDNPIVTERYMREVEKRKEKHVHTYYPGYLFCQDTLYVGTIKGLGRIYQQAGIDAYAGFSFAKVYKCKHHLKVIRFTVYKINEL